MPRSLETAMPINVQCPQCSRQLGVPDTLIGKKVKCPSCQTVFTAEEPGAAAAAPPPPPLAEDESEAPRPASTRRRAADEGAPSGDQEKARGMVNVPGILLIVYGILAVIACLLTTCSGIVQANMQGVDKDTVPILYVSSCLGFLTLIPAALTIFGGIKMRALQSYSLAMTGSIAAMFIWPCCCLVGIGIGVWSLIVLMNADVKAAFR
jgi:predicted Zn finger-like uncharacterized protein